MKFKKLFLFEDIVNDNISEQGHIEIVDALKDMFHQSKIYYFISVPTPRTYQFFVYANSLEERDTILKLFQENKVFFRYQELM